VAGEPSTGEAMASAEMRFNGVYERTFDSVYWFCQNRLGPTDGAAEDVAADVFTVVWRLIDKVPPPPGERVFVHAIAYRQIKNQQRRIASRLRLLRRIAAEHLASPLGAPQVVSGHIEAALTRLPEMDREAFLLVVVDSFSHAEAAQLLDCSPNAISLRLRRARARLRAELGASRPDPSGGELYLYKGGAS
jgi:RNA polymerase sigma factor (sigma-70 family)